MQDMNTLVGNWKLLSLQTIVDGAAVPPDLFALHPRGYLILTREGRMSLIITGEDAKKAAARTVDDLWTAIALALPQLTPSDCANYFTAGGPSDRNLF